jgi:hypothetical protein
MALARIVAIALVALVGATPLPTHPHHYIIAHAWNRGDFAVLEQIVPRADHDA